ncbi:MAG: hypothetical protein KBD50_03980 [Candidatus Pacebacteria bacterium]|nr:hypothetical protein [Candidatus Paceibacterota bacterium]
MSMNRRAFIEGTIAKVPDMKKRSESGIRRMRQFLRQSNWKKLRLLRSELEKFLEQQRSAPQ